MEDVAIIMKHVQLLDIAQPFPFITQTIQQLINTMIDITDVVHFLTQIPLQQFNLLEFYVYRLYLQLERQFMTSPKVVNRIIVEILSTDSISPNVFNSALSRLRTTMFANFDSFKSKITFALVLRHTSHNLLDALRLQPSGFSESQSGSIQASFSKPQTSLREIQEILKVAERPQISAAQLCENLMLQMLEDDRTQYLQTEEVEVENDQIEIDASGFWITDM